MKETEIQTQQLSRQQSDTLESLNFLLLLRLLDLTIILEVFGINELQFYNYSGSILLANKVHVTDTSIDVPSDTPSATTGIAKLGAARHGEARVEASETGAATTGTC